MKIYILGSTGYLGSYCVNFFLSQGHTVITDRVDVRDRTALSNMFKKKKPDAVINFAGVRAYPNIDWCEKNKVETIAVNVTGAINVVTTALEAGIYPVQLASGCVYTGSVDQPYTEIDEPNFTGSFYSRMQIVRQKALAELPVLQARIRMPLSAFKHPRNLITKLASYQKVISVPNSMIVVEDLAVALATILEKKPIGVLNLANPGAIKHKDILDAYKNIVDPKHSYVQISLQELEKNITTAKRSNCVLSSKKAESLGINIPALTEQRLEEIMQQYKKSLANA